MKSWIRGAAFAGALVAAGAAQATVVTVNVSLDANSIVAGLNGYTGGVQDVPAFSPPYSVSVAEMDEFSLTMHFLPGQVLTLNNPTLAWLFSYTSSSNFTDVVATGRLTLVDAAGHDIYTMGPQITTEGSVHLGQVFEVAELMGVPTFPVVSFSGLRYEGTVLDYVHPLVTSRDYNLPAFYFRAASFSVSNGAPLPVPASGLLAALGLAGLLVQRAVAGRRATR